LWQKNVTPRDKNREGMREKTSEREREKSGGKRVKGERKR
jgi:hypothetical protein